MRVPGHPPRLARWSRSRQRSLGIAPTGTVNFKDGGTTITGCGTAGLSGSGNSKTATCLISNLAVGVHSIVASYSGDPGNAASSSAPLSQVITSTAVPVAATFVGSDVATKGNWRGVYGADGYAILNDSTSYPAYAQVTPGGQQSYVWAAQPDSDPRALQRATTGRIAACWYSPGLVGSSFSVDVNLTDGAVHRVALYLLDWDTTVRVTRVDVLDAATQQVLSTQTLQSFNGGVYLVWNLQGHVILRFTSTGGSNAVLSGLSSARDVKDCPRRWSKAVAVPLAGVVQRRASTVVATRLKDVNASARCRWRTRESPTPTSPRRCRRRSGLYRRSSPMA